MTRGVTTGRGCSVHTSRRSLAQSEDVRVKEKVKELDEADQHWSLPLNHGRVVCWDFDWGCEGGGSQRLWPRTHLKSFKTKWLIDKKLTFTMHRNISLPQWRQETSSKSRWTFTLHSTAADVLNSLPPSSGCELRATVEMFDCWASDLYFVSPNISSNLNSWLGVQTQTKQCNVFFFYS